MIKNIFVGFAILAVSTSAAMAAHRAKPNATAAATTPSPVVWPTAPTAADKALYVKNQHDSGMKK